MKKMCLYRKIFITCSVIFLLNLSYCQVVDSVLVLEDTFDHPSLNENKWGVSFWPLNDGIQPEIVNSPTRAGGGAIKQTIQYMWNGEQNSNRSEIQGYRQKNPRYKQHKGYYQRLDETWIGFSIYFPSDSWKPDNRSKEVVFQLHGSADKG